MLAFTNDAMTAIRVLEQERGGTVRISASSTSLNGSGPALSLEIADGPEGDDEIVESDGAVVFLDPSTAAFDRQVLDAKVDAEGVRFSLRDKSEVD
jgi:Fe-S cluster assembly iron-binding protein IscA